MLNTPIHRIKLKDLDTDFIKRLQAEHGIDDTEVVLHIHPTSSHKRLTEEDFWRIIDRLDWKQAGKDEAVVEPVVEYLASLEAAMIYQFEDTLSQKLYQLDKRIFAEQDNENGYRPANHFSVDIFLYARCCVIANGRKVFEQVLHNPTNFPKDLTFEALLYVAHDAYKRKTGRDMDYIPRYNYETFSNKEGWSNISSQ